MTVLNLKERLDIAIYACKSAGKAVLKIRNANLKTQTSGDQLKSEADQISDEIIKRVIGEKYPDDFIISEESDSHTLDFNQLENFWIIDPLDGTRSFHGGFSGFCVQIAFFYEKELKLGAVYSPAEDAIYWAVKNRGSYKNSQSKTIKLHVSNTLNSYIESKKAAGEVAKILEVIGTKNFIECGSYGLKLCKVAEGVADLFIKKHEFKIWDVAAGDIILSEAHGELRAWDGRKIGYLREFDYKNLIASSMQNLQLVLNKIKNLSREETFKHHKI